MEVSFDRELLNEIADQSYNPPGADPALGAFYATLLAMIQADESIAHILTSVRKNRHDITNKHLVNLIYRAFQAIKFKQKDLAYQSFFDIPSWRSEFKTFFENDHSTKLFEQLLLTKSTITTIYQRYAGVSALISHLWHDEAVSVADLGCGGNYGLRGIEFNIPFQNIKDQTPGKVISRLLTKKIKLQKGLAVDKENPDDPSVREWRMACNFYPKELPTKDNVVKFEDRIRKSVKVRFIQSDLLSAKKLPKNSYDVVILSMILYQLNSEDQKKLINKAKRLLNEDGIIIIQDFAAKQLTDAKKLDFNKSWFGGNFAFRVFITGERTNWNFWEILRWENARCLDVKAGQDFRKVFPKALKYHSRTDSAALAHSAS